MRPAALLQQQEGTEVKHPLLQLLALLVRTQGQVSLQRLTELLPQCLALRPQQLFLPLHQQLQPPLPRSSLPQCLQRLYSVPPAAVAPHERQGPAAPAAPPPVMLLPQLLQPQAGKQQQQGITTSILSL